MLRNRPFPQLILASRSQARQNMLRGAGLTFTAEAADLNEKAITADLLKQAAGAKNIAQHLARQKALHVSQLHANAAEAPLVIGADQVLEFDGALLDKAESPVEAFHKLKRLKGRTHRLISAVCVVQGRAVLWSYEDAADLTMHDCDDAFLQQYCVAAGTDLTAAVGGYALEETGAWLFSEVRGDYYTVLGMPLLPLLGYLRVYHGFGP
jgi:septum formation protein